ncbi:MAG: EMC3/TMCO1 family protein [archaeon]|nr:EMC3/TMCO1 family protein [archaeon]
MGFLDSILNPVLLPLIDFNPFWGLLIISFFISLFITFVYKKVTDQNEMKRLKDSQKDFQRRMKEATSNPSAMKSIQKEAMEVNMKLMKHSFKPTLYTILPLLLIFGWMSAHLAFEPIYPGEQYGVTASFSEGVSEAMVVVDEGTELISEAKQEVTGAATWKLKSTEGEHFITVKSGDEEQTKKVLITTNLRYEEPISLYGDLKTNPTKITAIQINQNTLKPLGETEIFGWRPGWLGIYILSSLIFSIVLRKLLKVY